MLMKITPGKPYVRGYSIETISPQYLDVENQELQKILNKNP